MKLHALYQIEACGPAFCFFIAHAPSSCQPAGYEGGIACAVFVFRFVVSFLHAVLAILAPWKLLPSLVFLTFCAPHVDLSE